MDIAEVTACPVFSFPTWATWTPKWPLGLWIKHVECTWYLMNRQYILGAIIFYYLITVFSTHIMIHVYNKLYRNYSLLFKRNENLQINQTMLHSFDY